MQIRLSAIEMMIPEKGRRLQSVIRQHHVFSLTTTPSDFIIGRFEKNQKQNIPNCRNISKIQHKNNRMRKTPCSYIYLR
jgi:hypothetical protein